MSDWRADVLRFWFGLGPDRWWKADATLDDEIRERFLDLWAEKRQLPVTSFTADPLTALAATILFDQFPRNMFRGHAEQFATDTLALGIARAAEALGLPAVISFTVETDGRLASGETLRSAIERTDRETGHSPVYYMINCAHPTHFDDALPAGEAWARRIRGLRANASAKSHAELDESTELDPGDPVDLARRYRDLRQRMTQLSVLGGCCGTDHRHIAAICEACLPASGRAV